MSGVIRLLLSSKQSLGNLCCVHHHNTRMRKDNTTLADRSRFAHFGYGRKTALVKPKRVGLRLSKTLQPLHPTGNPLGVNMQIPLRSRT